MNKRKKLIVLQYLTQELLEGLETNIKREETHEKERKVGKGYTYWKMPQVGKAKLKRLRLQINELLRVFENE